MRFRDDSITFKLGNEDNEDIINSRQFANKYPKLHYKIDQFELNIEEGGYNTSEITVIMGQNGTGKSTFIKLLAGMIQSTNKVELPKVNLSYKPQTISPKFPGTVQELFIMKIPKLWGDPQFQSDVVKPLKVHELIDYKVQNLSGGELQRTAIVLALGKPAELYLLDEPSAFLDAEQRIIASKVIRKYILNFKKTCFMVEHDFIMAT